MVDTALRAAARLQTYAASPVAAVMGTRPEIIKMAPVVLALRARGLPVDVVHTGQHEDMAWPLYQFFGIEPQYSLSLNRTRPALAHLAGELMHEVSSHIEAHHPALVLVHGDTLSAAMAALACSLSRVPVAHVEAGLRSGDPMQPFPEEINRSLIGRLAQWHFAPTQLAADNLRAENVQGSVEVVGNTIVDAVQHTAERLDVLRRTGQPVNNAPLRWFEQTGTKDLIVVTAHRRENWGTAMEHIAHSVAALLASHPGAAVVWPLHPNPQVQALVRAVHGQSDAGIAKRWLLCDPQPYPQMIELLRTASLLLTDSGGIQEESVSLHKPIVILREVTERPEVLGCGAGVLVGCDPVRITSAVNRLLHSQADQAMQPQFHNPFGDGQAALRIATSLSQFLQTASV